MDRLKITHLIYIMLAAFAVVLGTRSATATEVLRLSMNVNQRSPWYKGAERFAKLLAKDSNGRYGIKIFPNAQLFMGNDQAEITGVQQGTVTFVVKSVGWMANLNDKFSVPLLPFLFSNHGVAEKVLDGPAGKKLFDLLPKYGLVGLAWGVNGFRQVTNNVRPITKPADIKGLRIRTPGAKIWLDTWKTLGADPTAMPFTEVYTALQTGAVDGQENPYSLIWANRFYEVQKYVTQWNYMYSPTVLVMNKDKWDRLSAADKKMFRDDAKQAMQYERSIVREEYKDLPKKLEAKGMKITVLNAAQLAVFKKAMQPVYKDMEADIGKKLIHTFVEASEKAAKE